MASPGDPFEGFLGEDEMTGAISSRSGQAGRNRQLVLVFADRGLWFDRERHDDLAVRLCRTLGTKPRPLPYSLPSGSFLASAAKSSLAA